MCTITLLLAGVFFYGLPSEVAVDVEEGTQAIPAPPVVKPSPTTAPTSIATSQTPMPKPNVVPATPKPEEPSVPLFPEDRGGDAVARFVSPESLPRPTLSMPVEVPTANATTRILPQRVAEPMPKPVLTGLPRLPLAPSKGLKPVSPTESVPLALTVWAADVPAKPVLPAGAPVKAKARDPAPPPPAPVMARPPALKASFDDPTTDAANEAIVNRPPIVVLVTAAFVKVGLPDPYVYAEQVRAKLDPAAEPGLTPVPVAPRRVK